MVSPSQNYGQGFSALQKIVFVVNGKIWKRTLFVLSAENLKVK